jgi:hypothetical protein
MKPALLKRDSQLELILKELGRYGVSITGAKQLLRYPYADDVLVLLGKNSLHPNPMRRPFPRISTVSMEHHKLNNRMRQQYRDRMNAYLSFWGISLKPTMSWVLYNALANYCEDMSQRRQRYWQAEASTHDTMHTRHYLS